MTGQCVTAECRKQFNMCEGLASFTEAIATKAQQWGVNFATAIRKTEVAEEVGRDTRTVTRYLNQLEELGLVETETKRGRNGGTVVMFNKDLLNFKPTDNPVTSDTKEAREIREQVFPTVPKKQPKRRYRTKAQIAEERALQAIRKDETTRLNDLLEATPVLTRDFFDNFEDPRLAFQGYLLAQMYTAYAVVFPKERQAYYADTDIKKSESAMRAFNKAKNYKVLLPRFVGTPQYNKFVDLAKFCNEQDINPLSYLTVQFEHTEYLSRIGVAHKEAIPYVNTLLSKDAIDRYYSRERFISEQRKKGLFGLSARKVPFIGASYPIITALLDVYEQDRMPSTQVDFVINRLVNRDLFDLSTKRAVLADYYTSVLSAVEDSDLTTEESTKLIQFLKEQVALYAERGGLNKAHFTLAFPLQIERIRTTCISKHISQSDYHLFLGNFNGCTPSNWEQINHFTQEGAEIDFSYTANNSFLSTIRLLADCKGLGVLPNEIHDILNKFGVEKVPLNPFGLLDVNRIYEGRITEEELEADRVREQDSYISA